MNIVPFIYPDPGTGEILNLASIKNIKALPAERLALAKAGRRFTIEVNFLDGSRRLFHGEAAKIVQGSANMHRQLAEQMIVQLLDPKRIVEPLSGGIIG